MAFVGIILNVCPEALGLEKSTGLNSIFVGNISEYFGILLALGFVLAVSYTRMCIHRTSHYMTDDQNLFYPHVFLLIFSAILTSGNPIIFKSEEILNYIAVSAGGFLFNKCLVNASRMEPNAGVLAIIQSTVVLFGAIFDIWLFGRVLHFWNIVGGAILVGSTLVAVLNDSRSHADEK